MRAIYVFRCGYCGVSETQGGAELTYDHFRPQSRNGGDEVANIVYACHACNEFKGDYWSEDELDRLLHPLRDSLDEHMREELDGTVSPLSELGRVYIHQLQLNRPALVGNRVERQKLSHIETRIVALSETVSEILSEIKDLKVRRLE